MFDDAFAHFKREIETGKIQVALLEVLDNAKRVQIVIEVPAMLAQQFVQLAFARMAERRMADVVHERSEEHTSELQSHHDLVCRLLLEKKKKKKKKRKNKTKTKQHKK